MLAMERALLLVFNRVLQAEA